MRLRQEIATGDGGLVRVEPYPTAPLLKLKLVTRPGQRSGHRHCTLTAVEATQLRDLLDEFVRRVS